MPRESPSRATVSRFCLEFRAEPPDGELCPHSSRLEDDQTSHEMFFRFALIRVKAKPLDDRIQVQCLARRMRRIRARRKDNSNERM